MSSVDKKSRLYYHRLPDFARKEKKLDFLCENSLSTVDWQRLVPNTRHTWRRTDTEDEFASYLPVGSKESKRAKPDQAEAIFKSFSGGVKTNRDMYVYDYSFDGLSKRMRQFVEDYNSEVDRYRRQTPKPDVNDFVNYDLLKWDGTLKSDLRIGNYGSYELDKLRYSQYRPFTKKTFYFDSLFINSVYLQQYFFPNSQAESENRLICIPGPGNRKGFGCLVSDAVPSLDLAFEKVQCFPFYTYDEDGSNRRENITDWAFDQFRSHYHDPAITKWDIFYYVYGLLHHPGYRERYALDLKRNLPRIPFAPTSSPSPFMGEGAGGWGFWPFSRAGAQLADLHLNYESADRYELEWQSTRKPVSYRVEKMLPKGKVDSSEGAYKVYSTLKYNDTLTLHEIPERAFAYRLGNRSALDWIVDQYRVKTDKRSGITHDPNGYSDDPQYILKLIERVITVSLRTVDIVEKLAKLPFRLESADG